MEKQVYDIGSLIEGEGLTQLVEKAQKNLRDDGGNPTSALMYVQMVCDRKVGAMVAVRGETSLVKPLETAIRELQDMNIEPSGSYVDVIVTLFDGPRFGTAIEASIDPANYIKEDE